MTRPPGSTVTATRSSSTAQVEVVVIQVLGDGGHDAIGAFTSSSGTTESDAAVTVAESNITLFLSADSSGTFSNGGGGQIGLPGYPTPPEDVTAWGSYQPQFFAGSASLTRTSTAGTVLAVVSIGSVGAGSSGTASPFGIATGHTPIPPSGAAFGPDAVTGGGSGVTMNGILEASSAIGPTGSTSNGSSIHMSPGLFTIDSQIPISTRGIASKGSGGPGGPSSKPDTGTMVPGHADPAGGSIRFTPGSSVPTVQALPVW